MGSLQRWNTISKSIAREVPSPLQSDASTSLSSLVQYIIKCEQRNRKRRKSRAYSTTFGKRRGQGYL
jgi:hypothetical protein